MTSKTPFFIVILLIISFFVGAFLILEFQITETKISEIFLAQTSVKYGSKNKKKLPTLIFVGDIMLDRGVERMVEEHGKEDYRFPFLQIADYLKEADILFGNLEGPISDKGKKVGSIYSFRSEPKAIEGLVFAGFDILSVANNHVFDYGKEAMEDTFLRLKLSGIDYVGGGFDEQEAYYPVVKEVDGAHPSLNSGQTKIAFLAYTDLGSKYWAAKGKNSGIAWLDKERMMSDIKNTKNKADIVIISFHYGREYNPDPSSFQISISRAAIDAGADLVIGHHPHVVQSIEKYKEGYIAYSLGNFVFDQSFSESTMKGQLLKAVIKDNRIKELIPIEIKINEFFQPEITGQ